MKRCRFCQGIVWPWQRQKIRAGSHLRCWLAARQMLIEDNKAWQLEQARLRWKEEDQL